MKVREREEKIGRDRERGGGGGNEKIDRERG